MSSTSSSETLYVPHMTTTHRWESRDLMRKPKVYGWQAFRSGNSHTSYTTWASVEDVEFTESVLYNVMLRDSTLNNCHIHIATPQTTIRNCLLRNCVITTNSKACIDVDHRSIFINCTLNGNFIEPVRKDIRVIATDEVLTQLPPYEVFNNVVLKDGVIDRLRKWVWRFRNAKKGLYGRNAGRWKGKAASKRPLEVSDIYDPNEQLEMPGRRALYSCEYTKAIRPLKRKKQVDLRWMNLDD